MNRRIQDLNPKEILALAIALEQANGRCFQQFAVAFAGHDDQAASKWWELAEEESTHEEWLTGKFQRRFEGPVPSISQLGMEGFLKDLGFDPELPARQNFKADQVYRIALDAENRAARFYQEAESSAGDPSVALLFRQLAVMEKEHSDWLVQKMSGRLVPLENKGGRS